MKILVGIPTYDGKLQCEVVQAIMNEYVAAREVGDQLILNMLPGISHLPMGRNQLARNFVLSNCDRLVFLDGDVTWQVGELLKIAHSKEPFVGGAYRYKWEEEEHYPVGWDNSIPRQANENGLLDVVNVPTGFLSLSKEVFQKIRESYPERAYEHFGEHHFAYFSMPYQDGALYGEDAHFCKLWKDLGEKIWLDPELNLTHWKNHQPFHGQIGKWLKAKG
jgi:hypothetical protein